MTLWKFFTTRYTDHLEQENSELKKQLAEERAEVRRLTDAAIPALSPKVVQSQLLPTAPRHKMTKSSDNQRVNCICGWKAESEDPIELQNAVSEHYRLSFPPINKKAVTLSDIRRKLESASEVEAKKENQA